MCCFSTIFVVSRSVDERNDKDAEEISFHWIRDRSNDVCVRYGHTRAPPSVEKKIVELAGKTHRGRTVGTNAPLSVRWTRSQPVCSTKRTKLLLRTRQAGKERQRTTTALVATHTHTHTRSHSFARDRCRSNGLDPRTSLKTLRFVL